ncbi:MAG: tripartite tricarboxylate transporter TctB family protein [Synergistaceae bacterium]|jgi:hypothetical protein|nr:tripartite tricarboxylate transporter TctB family protein [Synergistaceae bacterium]
MSKISKIPNLYSGLFSVVFGLIVVNLSADIKAMSLADPVGPSRYPMILGIAIAVMGAMLFVPFFAGKGEGIEGKAETLNFKDFIPLLKVILWCAFFTFSFEWIGFVPANIVMLLGCTASLGERNIKKMLLFSVICSRFLYILFRHILGIALPAIPFFYI